MWAMLIGIATSFMMFGFIIISKLIIAAILGIIAQNHKMKTLNWVIAGLLLDFWTLLVFIIVRFKISSRKCPSCEEKVPEGADFCCNCGEVVPKIDDGKIAKKFVFYVFLTFAVFIVLDSVIPMIIQ